MRRRTIFPWVLIAAKSLDAGKSRLRSVLSDGDRRQLNQTLLMRMLAAASGYPGHAHTAVVSECSDVLRLADDIGALPIRQTAGPGLNNAVSQGVDVLHSVRAGAILVVAADLPLVTTDDLMSIAAAGRKRSLVILTDKHRTGTNALHLPPGITFRFQFGPNSCAAHYREGMAAAAATSVLFNARIAFDIDTPEDLHEWRRVDPSPQRAAEHC